MADNAQIRLENFRRLYPADAYGPADLVRKLGSTKAFWSDLRAGRKSFGEKLARSIEERGDLAPGSLDDPEGAYKMPLSADMMNRLARLSPEELARVDALLRAHLGPLAEGDSGKAA